MDVKYSQLQGICSECYINVFLSVVNCREDYYREHKDDQWCICEMFMVTIITH